MGKKRKGKRASQKRKNQPYYKVQSVSKCDHSVEEKPAVKLKAERDHDRPSHDVRYDDGAGAILGISVSFCEDMSPGAICSSIQGALESKLKKMYLPEDEILEILTPNSCDRTTFDVHMKTVRGKT